MKLVSEKIYKVIPFLRSQTLPILKVKGSASVYVSLAQTAPTSVSDMDDITEEIEEGFNTLTGQIRYICAVFSGDSEVEESGIVTSQETTDRLS